MVLQLLGAPAAGAYVFWTAFAVQSFHFLEHFIQIHQHFLGVEEPQGLIGSAIDFVWVHLAYNFAFLTALLFAFRHFNLHRSRWGGTGGRKVFLGLVWFQTYHTFEHIVQSWQHYRHGIHHPPGIIGNFIPNIIAHFDINAAAMVLLAVVAMRTPPLRVAGASHVP